AGEVGSASPPRFAQHPRDVPMKEGEDLGGLGQNPVDRLVLLVVVSRHLQVRRTEVQELLGVQFDSHACSLPWATCLENHIAQWRGKHFCSSTIDSRTPMIPRSPCISRLAATGTR